MRAKWIQLWGGLVTAMRTLTVLPWPGRDADSPAAALPWFPLVGAIIGSIVYLVIMLLGTRLLWADGGAALALVVGVVITGGLHLDGLADAVDGWRGGRTRERRLEIMKDPHLGAFGSIGLFLVLFIKAAALSLFTLSSGMGIILAATISRWFILPAGLLPLAHPGGLGAAAGLLEDLPGLGVYHQHP